MKVNIDLADGTTILGVTVDERLRDIEERLNNKRFVNIGKSIYRVQDILSVHEED